MQVVIKKQLKVVLNQHDIVQAVDAFLRQNGHELSAEDIATINFVKSPKDGLRATLDITEDTVTGEDGNEEEARVSEEPPVKEPEPVALVVEEPASDPTPEVEEDEQPGEVAQSTVEDVAVPDEQPAPSRAALFGNN